MKIQVSVFPVKNKYVSQQFWYSKYNGNKDNVGVNEKVKLQVK